MKPSAEPPISKLVLLGVFALFAIVPFLFALYTDNRWEDYYITFRASKNLALGNGLVFTVGERLCTFTSPIGTLLPALCSWLVGPDRDDAALWLFRLVSIGAMGLAGMLAFVVLHQRKMAPLIIAALLTLLATDAKTVMFTINGMETAFVILGLSLMLYVVTVETGRTWIWLGIVWGWAMWTRPDGFIYVGALALSILIFKAGLASERGRGWLLRRYVWAGLLAAVIYLPWILWAYSYYGSPVSNTIVAKSLHRAPGVFFQNSHNVLVAANRVRDIFAPPYTNEPGWSLSICLWYYLLWLLAALPLVLPRMSSLTRASAAAFLLTSFYLSYIVPFPYPWYLPNCAWLGFLSLGLGFHDFCSIPSSPPRNDLLSGLRWPQASLGIVGTTVLMQLYVLGCVSQEMDQQQRLIEFGVRKQVGLWLKRNAVTPRDTVFLEPLGYIGYYSNLKMYDYPGLASREVISARKRLNTDNWLDLIEDLHPDWLVLRPEEAAPLQSQDRFSQEYQLVQVFDAKRAVSALDIHGRGFLEYDQTFGVFHRKE